MKLELLTRIPGHPYPTAGGGYRCFKDGRWHDCDSRGEYQQKAVRRMNDYDVFYYKGKSLMFWALEWFRMSNDTFYRLYGFNFNPHQYPGLYEAAREQMYGEERG